MCCTVWHHVTTLHTRLKTLEKLRSTKLSSDVLNNVGETDVIFIDEIWQIDYYYRFFYTIIYLGIVCLELSVSWNRA